MFPAFIRDENLYSSFLNVVACGRTGVSHTDNIRATIERTREDALSPIQSTSPPILRALRLFNYLDPVTRFEAEVSIRLCFEVV